MINGMAGSEITTDPSPPHGLHTVSTRSPSHGHTVVSTSIPPLRKSPPSPGGENENKRILGYQVYNISIKWGSSTHSGPHHSNLHIAICATGDPHITQQE